MSKQMLEIESKDQLNKILKTNNGVLIIDFTSPVCPPCLMLEPILEELVDKDMCSVAKVNVFECQDIAQEFNISATPTLLIYKNDKLIKTELGYKPLESWVEIINKI